MTLQGEHISLVPYTLEKCHEIYKHYSSDPMMTDQPYLYDKNMVDLYYRDKATDSTRVFFAISYEGNTIGEIQLKRIDTINKCGTLSIILTDDSVKNRGFGTEAERLLIEYAFSRLALETIYADAVLRNARSRHVLEKIGFEHIYDDEILAYYRLEKNRYL